MHLQLEVWYIYKSFLDLAHLIVYTFSALGRFQYSGLDHEKAAKKFMKYLERTKEFMLTFTSSDDLHIVGYANSDFTSNLDDSMSGHVFRQMVGAVLWKTDKQSITASFPTQEKFMAYWITINSFG